MVWSLREHRGKSGLRGCPFGRPACLAFFRGLTISLDCTLYGPREDALIVAGGGGGNPGRGAVLVFISSPQEGVATYDGLKIRRHPVETVGRGGASVHRRIRTS